jgi:glycosyltransferase involved in cell wall biosynthesis
VAVEVSALGRGSYDQRAFVEFALGALTADDSTSHATWSAGWLRRRDRIEGARPSRRSWLVSRSMVLGMAPRASWVAPRAQVTFLASGPALLRVARSGVITILSIADVLRVEAGGFSSRSVGAQLRRSAGEGVIVHAACQAAADAAVSVLELDRSSVVVALPGIREARERGPESFDAIGVVAGSNRSLDVATVDSIQQRGVPAELIAANVTSSRPCVVFASPGDGFPFAALEALARDTPVVASRTPTTTEILEGAVVLVESVAAGDIADAAVALATNDARRGLAIAAGRARAGDFSCQRRAPELVSVLRRALASR